MIKNSFLQELLTFDNLLHWLVCTLAAGVLGAFLINSWVALGMMCCLIMYCREVLQIKSSHGDWDFLLRGSLHKHLEWATGGAGGFLGGFLGQILHAV